LQGERRVSRWLPRIAAVILAAGRSTRMGPENKLLADLNGKPIVRWVAEAALASQARPVLAVVGHEAAEVKAALASLDARLVDNLDYATGLASSLRAGIRALPEAIDGALVLLGDMPRIAAAHLDQLIAASASGKIAVPVHEGRSGNPVLWPARYFPELLALQGDAGAKRLLATHAADVHEVDLGTDGIFVDIDTPDALAQERENPLFPFLRREG
jgi:molybdenum cofactor cytidylyltransferase